MGGVIGLTGYTLMNRGLFDNKVPGYAEFATCGQNLRVGGDVKERGVLVGEISQITHTKAGDCRITLGLFPESLEDVPSNVSAQIRAKTIFGEKWVELIYPRNPSGEHFAAGDTIPQSRTIEPLEVETILNLAMPLLSAIDPHRLAGALDALAGGFVGHERAAVRAMTSGIEALKPVNRNEGLVRKGVAQLGQTADVLNQVDQDLLQSLRNLDKLNRFTVAHAGLIGENLNKAPALLNELTRLFRQRFGTITKLVRSGATVLDVLAARSGDLDRLLKVLPVFDANWIRNLNHQCVHRQANDEEAAGQPGDPVPGRCWRVHNLLSHSRGPYGADEGPAPGRRNRRRGR